MKKNETKSKHLVKVNICTKQAKLEEDPDLMLVELELPELGSFGKIEMYLGEALWGEDGPNKLATELLGHFIGICESGALKGEFEDEDEDDCPIDCEDCEHKEECADLVKDIEKLNPIEMLELLLKLEKLNDGK